MAWVLGAPVDLFAALGFLAVFAAATNTPLACTIMGIELFGAEFMLYFRHRLLLCLLFLAVIPAFTGRSALLYPNYLICRARQNERQDCRLTGNTQLLIKSTGQKTLFRKGVMSNE